MNAEFNSESVERFVHGELSITEQAAILKSCCDKSDQWKTLAMAFVEKQMIDDAASHYLSEHDAIAQVTLPHTPKLANRSAGFWTCAAVACAAIMGVIVGANVSATKPADTRLVSHSQKEIELEEALARSDRPVVDAIKNDLLAAGVLVDPTHDLYKVRLPNGERVEMKVRGYRVQLLGGTTFQ